MISGFGMACFPVASGGHRGQAVEAGRPAGMVAVARRPALEALLQQHQTGAAKGRLEADADFGLVAARAALVFPGPAEREPPRRLDRAVDAADRQQVAVAGPAQDGAPAAAGAEVEDIE